MAGKYCLCFTDEILNEYEEIIAQRTGSADVARNIIQAILNRTNTKHIRVYFRFELIKEDPDDNKFVDCAIKAEAKYIVSEDHHFDVLKDIKFPPVNVIGIDEFLQELQMAKQQMILCRVMKQQMLYIERYRGNIGVDLLGFANAGRFINEEKEENNMYTFEPVKFNSEEERLAAKRRMVGMRKEFEARVRKNMVKV